MLVMEACSVDADDQNVMIQMMLKYRQPSQNVHVRFGLINTLFIFLIRMQGKI